MRAHSDAHGLEAMDANGPPLLLADHHRSLRRAGEALLARAYEDDCHELVKEYRVFEAQLLEHIAAEEKLILPELARHEPAEAAAIRASHEAIKKQLYRTAIDVELHTIKLTSLRALLDLLDEHSKREDALMYPWAQVHLPVREHNALTVRLIASFRELARLAGID